MGLAEVSDTLWRERELLELLVFKLDVEQLLADIGERRCREWAAREVDLLLEQLRCTELLRAIQTDEVAAALGLAPGATLQALADAAGEPWRSILREHRQALLDWTAQVSARGTRRTDVLEEAQ